VPIAETARPRVRVPNPLTSFIGRYDEIEAISSFLRRADVRLLTLTGAGGTGKTRLAIEVAKRFEDDRQLDTSVYFVTLASVLRVQDAMPAIAESVGIWDAQKGDLVQRCAQSLSGGPTLLVLDNLEHVIEIAIDISRILLACPNLTVLVTSRVPLHIQGEREYSVPQLTMADPATMATVEELMTQEAIALFVDRAETVNQTFELDDDNAQFVAQICVSLDGLPLAIELAAARMKAIPPAVLLGRLDNQLRILRSDTRDVPDRLQTMRATVDWSYQLLEQSEQQSLRYLSAFAGDFSIAAAGYVLELEEDEAIDVITSLIDKSLILPRGVLDSQPFYRILTVLREFGLEQLEFADEAEAVRLRHAEYIAQLAEDSFAGQFEANQAQVFLSLDRIHVSIRQALNWTILTERWELAARIAAHLWQYWVVRGNFAEGRQWFERLLAQEYNYPLRLTSNLYFGFAYLAGSHEDVMRNAEMAARLKKIGATSRDPRLIATASILTGIRPWDTNGMQESLAAIDLWKGIGEPIWAGRAASEVSRLARELGDIDMAEDYAYQAYDLLLSTGHVWGIAQTTTGVSRILYLRGNTQDAIAMLKKALSLITVIGDRILVFRVMEILIQIAGSQSLWVPVVRFSAATSRIRKLIGYDVRSSFEQAAIDVLLEKARSALGKGVFSAEWNAGLQLSLEEATAEAMAIELPDRVDRLSSCSAGLSRREHEVLQHIITGQTDQEIADELFLSYRTITTHVTHILNKLGASSRTEAAAIAVRDRLV
jgi:predicted ATPase/DNA-binding NarL/FixJ family response regulator